jgi:catechol 2,3-dioxygenase-like lactoylglutathione lyase family enzyme
MLNDIGDSNRRNISKGSLIMPHGTLEHANITVTEPDRSAALLKQLCGWEERWRGGSLLGGWTIHVGVPGDGRDYIAVYTNDELQAEAARNGGLRYAKGLPLNHIGLMVDDLDAAERVVIAAGLTPFSHGDYEPGRRFYFFDWDGIEFEIVSYSQ